MCAEVADDVEAVWIDDGALKDAGGEPVARTLGGGSDGAIDGGNACEDGDGSDL